MAVALSILLGISPQAAEVQISGLTADSRHVSPGDLFVALPGTVVDGRDYIDQAIKAGAAAVLSTPDVEAVFDIPLIVDKNPRRKYAELVARFYNKQPEHMVAITGTNGKTSIADFVRQIWSAEGMVSASMGTLGIISDRLNHPGGLTTPDPAHIHKALSDMATSGITHAALEASSHGLDQYRLDGVDIEAAGFANLSRDHMDYHKTENHYFYTKARLFGELLRPGKLAVINTDGRWGQMLEDLTWGRGINILTTGRNTDADIRLVDIEPKSTGMVLTVNYGGAINKIRLPLIGGFQADNALLAAGLATSSGMTMATAFERLEGLVGVPGRMEYIGSTHKGGSVYVDYAHTPDGLETVLKAARAHNPAKLHVVFGCGGDRDAGKRPMMGEVAARCADTVFVTDDNPRTEDAAPIRAQILAACPQAKEIGDRAAAIAAAMEGLQTDDMLIIAGKGHEEGQIVGDQIIPFSDIATVRHLLGGLG